MLSKSDAGDLPGLSLSPGHSSLGNLSTMTVIKPFFVNTICLLFCDVCSVCHPAETKQVWCLHWRAWLKLSGSTQHVYTPVGQREQVSRETKPAPAGTGRMVEPALCTQGLPRAPLLRDARVEQPLSLSPRVSVPQSSAVSLKSHSLDSLCSLQPAVVGAGPSTNEEPRVGLTRVAV